MANLRGSKRRAEYRPRGEARQLSSPGEGEVKEEVELTTAAETTTEVTFCLEFDGASKGNPGKAGAGALLKRPDGSVICELMKGVGVATCNFAEYQALIIGLQAALQHGIHHIEARGDSKLVCKQVMGLWKLRSENLRASFAEVIELKKRFQYFSVKHVYRFLRDAMDEDVKDIKNQSHVMPVYMSDFFAREFNSAADKLANAATLLPEDKLVSEFVTTPFTSSCNLKGEAEAKIQLENLMNEPSLSTFLSTDAKIVFYQLSYHGASKGNPGKAGAGVVVSCPDGSMHLRIKQGLGISSRNYAHYHALIIGLQAALDHNISHIKVQGDSVLVFKQMIQQTKVKDVNLLAIWKEANALLTRFTEHSFCHVEQSANSEACILARSAILLPEDNVIRANLCDGSGMCDSSTAEFETAMQKLFLNRIKISKESSSKCGYVIARPTQFLRACMPCHSILHPKYTPQASRVVVPRPSNSLFSLSMLKHRGNCTKWKNLPHLVFGFMSRFVEAAPITISTINSFR